MDGEIYLCRDRFDGDQINLYTGDGCESHRCRDDELPHTLSAWGSVPVDALFAIFGASAHEVLDKLDEAEGPVAFTLNIPEL